MKFIFNSKRQSKTLMLALGLVVIILGVINFFGPYNVLTAASADFLSKNEDIKNQLGNASIKSVKYIGQHTYLIHTDKQDYMIVERTDKDGLFSRYAIYQYKDTVKSFNNPM